MVDLGHRKDTEDFKAVLLMFSLLKEALFKELKEVIMTITNQI